MATEAEQKLLAFIMDRDVAVVQGFLGEAKTMRDAGKMVQEGCAIWEALQAGADKWEADAREFSGLTDAVNRERGAGDAWAGPGTAPGWWQPVTPYQCDTDGCPVTGTRDEMDEHYEQTGHGQ